MREEEVADLLPFLPLVAVGAGRGAVKSAVAAEEEDAEVAVLPLLAALVVDFAVEEEEGTEEAWW